ncbi:peptidoglycan DD-metalloendopeptidase family protein [Streptomyces sp. NPDC002187]|uniref:peptidoglycan DD-metalloendopeptidase family protein n=1 Tax=Streptomyces sp. NPDC002187 TaxID=3364637 RepID=UPI0036970FFF
MPAKGKHRRPKSNRITRGFIAAGTGGAAIALPLMGATGAHAAGNAAPATAPAAASGKAHAAAPATFSAGSAAHAPAGKKATTYSVVPGDHLSKIAAEHDVRGGWQSLYADNREAVGENPSLIHPGLKLTINGKGKAKASEAKAPEQSESPSESQTRPSGDDARPAPADTAEPVEQQSSEPSAEQTSEPAQSSEPSAEQTSAPEQASGSGFAAPIEGAPMSTAYRTAGAMWSSGYHTGVDFAAATGTSVKSVTAGTVVSAGWGGAYGNQVVIQHTDGTYSQYAHLSSLSISSGESVTGGQQIGLSGNTGNSSGPHLHFEIRTGPGYGSDVDPLAYLRQNGVSI